MTGNKRKAVEPLFSAAIYIGISIAAVTLVVSIGGPAIEKFTDIAAIDQARDALVNLDRIMRAVAAEGTGSTRVITLQLRKGDLLLNPTADSILYEIETFAEAVSPRTKRVFGNIIIGSNTLATLSDNGTFFIMQNEHITIPVPKIGNSTNYTTINASRLVASIFNIDESKFLNGTVFIRPDDDSAKETGQGFTAAVETGTSLPRARVNATINSTTAYYEILLTLESGADFLTIEVKNFLPQ